MAKLQKYIKIFTLSFVNSLKNYKALIGLSIFLMTCLIIFAHLWKIAAAKVNVTYLDPTKLLWYIAFNEWILVSIPDTQDEIEHDLRSGRLAYLLSKPISYLGATFSEALGTFCVNFLTLGVVTFLFTWFQVGILPFPIMGIAIILIFSFLAGLLAILFHMLIGISAFWVQEVSPFHWIWEKLLFMLGGLILPVTVYPKWLQIIAQYTPFPIILGHRSALALDYNIPSIILLGSYLLCWILFASICLVLLYRKGMRILNIEGG